MWVGTASATLDGGLVNSLVAGDDNPLDYFNAYNVVQGKIWQRIKGFFKKVFRTTATWLPRIAAVASKVLPPPVGTVVGAVGVATSAIGVAVKAVAGVKNVTALTLAA